MVDRVDFGLLGIEFNFHLVMVCTFVGYVNFAQRDSC